MFIKYEKVKSRSDDREGEIIELNHLAMKVEWEDGTINIYRIMDVSNHLEKISAPALKLALPRKAISVKKFVPVVKSISLRQLNQDRRERKPDWTHPSLRMGEEHPKSLLTKEIVLDIRSSELPDKELAKKYGVSVGCIHNARTFRTWKHING